MMRILTPINLKSLLETHSVEESHTRWTMLHSLKATQYCLTQCNYAYDAGNANVCQYSKTSLSWQPIGPAKTVSWDSWATLELNSDQTKILDRKKPVGVGSYYGCNQFRRYYCTHSLQNFVISLLCINSGRMCIRMLTWQIMLYKYEAG